MRRLQAPLARRHGPCRLSKPEELVEKLAALIPPPRFHVVRYHGILAPRASERDRVVPGVRKAPVPARLPPESRSVDLPIEPIGTAAAGVRFPLVGPIE